MPKVTGNKEQTEYEELKKLAKECGADVTDYVDYAYSKEVVLFENEESLLKFVEAIRSRSK